ncbi:DUF4189 domain-containing protein [Lysobacter antibioticus]|uniref:DUF4189 domain-containing protein n=1 Tax=Lysobacter antibioticus TaxID=84531 RepID=UPI0007E8BBC5|nr:DUF4189 domain-containing protein [Lysobacter antibioticus]
MRVVAWRWPLALALAGACVPAPARAEGVCPPGMLPYRTGNEQACAPAPPNYYPEPAPPREVWGSRWGAVALDGPRGAIGTAHGAASKRQARREAVEDCRTQGGRDCRVQIDYRNQCVAIAVSDSHVHVRPSELKEDAVEHALRECGERGEAHCRSYYAACSLPVRVR